MWALRGQSGHGRGDGQGKGPQARQDLVPLRSCKAVGASSEENAEDTWWERCAEM